MPALVFLPAFVDMPRHSNRRVSNMFFSRDKWQRTLTAISSCTIRKIRFQLSLGTSLHPGQWYLLLSAQSARASFRLALSNLRAVRSQQTIWTSGTQHYAILVSHWK